MMGGGIVFCPVVGEVGFAQLPINFKLLLTFAISEPVEVHIHGFGTLRLNFTIDNSIISGVVGLDGVGNCL
jgi:hypothetical protein